MAPVEVSRRLALLTTSLRGSPTGGESTLVEDTRTRLGGLPKKATNAEMQRWLAWGLVPLIEYLAKAFTVNDIGSLSDGEYGDRLFDMLKIVRVRTKLLQKYGAILDDELE